MSDSKIFVGIRPIRGSRPRNPTISGPMCQWEGCGNVGTQKASVGGTGDGLYLLFCANHARQYNKGYNHSPSKSDPEVAKYQLDAAAGRIPTRGVRTIQHNHEMPLPSSVPSGSAKSLRARGKALPNAAISSQPKLKPLDAKALATLGLPLDATPEEIRRRYKERLKLDHPDANNGNRQSEERLRATINAHRILKQSGFC